MAEEKNGVWMKRQKRLREAGNYIVTGVLIYNQGTVELVRRVDYKDRGETTKRTEIREFSRASRERLAIVSRETIHTFNSLMTLTYGKQFPMNGREVKKHLNRFLNWYRRYVGGEYIWWLEFQKRGAPHLHFASQKGDVRQYDREEFAHRWARAQGLTYGLFYTELSTRTERNLYDDVVAVHSHARQWQVARKADGPKRYILKYALKMRQKEVPKNYRDVGRFYGYSRDIKASIPEPMFVPVGECDVRAAMREVGHIARDWECLPKYIWGLGEGFDKKNF